MLTPKVRPRIGLLPTGHKIYWGQFPNLKKMGTAMYEKLLAGLDDLVTATALDAMLPV